MMRCRTQISGFALAALSLGFCMPVNAHELRPAYLELREVEPAVYAVLWKTPMRGEMRLSLAVELSGAVQEITRVVTRDVGNAAVQTWQIHAVEPLRGQSVRIVGLNGTMTDVLARIEFADGTTWMQRLTPQSPEAIIPARQSAGSVAWGYAELGVQHILEGIDHLLFVAALLLITRGWWRLTKTVTAFTVAHSITLALATFGVVHVPQTPVEALIALSIAFVAAEAVQAIRGRQSLASRAPWLVAFAFGLLHGLGFAGALTEIGLPQGQIPLALLFFNVGVEAGQLLFIAGILPLLVLLRAHQTSFPRWSQFAPPYAIGSLAMFWMIQRVAAF